jgi:hypothetical protein
MYVYIMNSSFLVKSLLGGVLCSLFCCLTVHMPRQTGSHTHTSAITVLFKGDNDR